MPKSSLPPAKAGTVATPAVVSPDLLKYTDYRQFLKDYFQAHQLANPGFSLRHLAKQVNFPSHGLLQHLIDGKRNLTKKILAKLPSALGLNKEQSRYFEDLVFFNQAKKLDEKNFYYEKLVKSPLKSSFRLLEASQLQLFRKWFSVAILEMLNLKGFRNNPSWIASRFLPNVEPYEVEESLEMLLSTGIIKKTIHGFKAAGPDITTHDEVKSFLVKGYHDQMLKLAGWAQDEISSKERDISSVCFSIKESELPNLKKQIQLMRKELRNFAAENGEGERIVQLNIQLFPLSKAK